MYENLTRMRLILTYKVTRFKAKLLVISNVKVNLFKTKTEIYSWYIVLSLFIKSGLKLNFCEIF